MKYEKFCFHATHKDNILPILTDGFKPSKAPIDDRYLGKGIYFMEEDKEAARRFCKNVTKTPESVIGIIKVKISSNNYFDLNDTVTYDYFLKIINKLKHRLLIEGEKRPRVTPGMALDFIFNTSDFDFVRHSFQLHPAVSNRVEAVQRNNTYICVWREVCISEHQEVS